jgi:Xaa-Pro aminopeptidase
MTPTPDKALHGLPDLDFAERRSRLLDALDGGIAVFRAPPLVVHANDVEYRYHPEANFRYLTGFCEPDAVALFDASAEREKFVLFVAPRDPEREGWTGARSGIEGAVEQFGADAAYPIGEVDRHLTKRIAASTKLHYHVGTDHGFDHRILDLARNAWASRPRTAPDHTRSILDTAPLVHEMRVLKSDDEIAWMQRSSDIAAEAHIRAMRETQPGMGEHEIEALIEYTFRRRGAAGWAYPSIVAGGANATVLHYISNDQPLHDGDLLLIDAGCELGSYCSDITRTFPVGRDFTPAQRRVYDLVLESQEVACRAVKPGATLDAIHDEVVEILAEGLLSLGLLEGTTEQVIRDGSYKPFYMHRTSHWLGMDVHDVGAYSTGGSPRPLEPGMVATIEPGLYFSPALEGIPEEYRGIGIRIEDDVLVTHGGHRVLTEAVPKRPDEILALRAEAP